MSVILGLLVIIQSVPVIYAPHTFVRVVNLIVIIFLSAIVGAFIREVFVLKKK
ncbi:hypothetical protein ACQCT3_08865 [Sutcliffiella horikoshii]|nr:hypothetical protein [Sutcliffiella horikoshii]